MTQPLFVKHMELQQNSALYAHTKAVSHHDAH